MEKEKPEVNNITTNRQARRDYFILETVEAGIVLIGSEVKSLREAQANLKGSFARIDEGELFLHNLYITPYTKSRKEELDPNRIRKLLLHHQQIIRLLSKQAEKGLALIPLRMYFNKRGIAKVELAVAKGKKLFDKRSEIKRETASREVDRAIKNRNRGRP